MRILLKLSGEALAGDKKNTFDIEILKNLSLIIKQLLEKNIQIGIVIGGGNIFRGINGEEFGFQKVSSDYMGMLATFINGLALQDFFKNFDIKSKLLTATQIECIGERYDKNKALGYLQDGYVTIFAGGIWNPYFTTDTLGVLRALELECDMMIKATKVDGVYDKDPKKFKEAIMYEKVTYDEVLAKNLKVMDSTAIALAREGKLKLKVINLFKSQALLKAINGEKEGTTIM